MGYEGSASRAYFSILSSLLPDEFQFKGRSKMPPLDAFNSLVSLGYTLLMYELYGELENKGLCPYVGFMHSDRERHPTLASDLMEEWRAVERKKWEESNAEVTKQFFFILLSFKGEETFPPNDNPQRRIQDIKDAGYTIGSVRNGRKMTRYLLPIPLYSQMGYETFTPQFKNRVIRLLKGINAYEAKPTAIKALIPDHKFSEVRWDEETKKENPMEMTDEQIIQKFQLLDNQRNQQKREVCRKCFQDNIRGQIFGIEYFGEGEANWDDKIPKVGKVAEKGCEGCPWYDIEAWRKSLNQTIKKK